MDAVNTEETTTDVTTSVHQLADRARRAAGRVRINVQDAAEACAPLAGGFDRIEVPSGRSSPHEGVNLQLERSIRRPSLLRTHPVARFVSNGL